MKFKSNIASTESNRKEKYIVKEGSRHGRVSDSSKSCQFLIGCTLLLICSKQDVLGSVDGDIAKFKQVLETGLNVSTSENALTSSRALLSLIESNVLNPPQFQHLTTYLISKKMISALFNPPIGFFGGTALSEAVKSMEVETRTLHLLHQHGANFSALDRNGNSIVRYALRGKRSRQLLTDLIQVGGINVDHINKFGRSLLHAAAQFCHVEGVNFCLDQGLNVNALDYFGDTPLHKAMIFGIERVVETAGTLIENGGKVDIRNMMGEIPMDIALGRFGMADKDKVIQLLKDHGNVTAS